MKFIYKNSLLTVILTFLISNLSFAQTEKFILILDAGHGGKDPGNSYHGFSEKEIALKTTLKVGEYLAKDKEIKIIYTRVTDEFIELVNRPKIANKANANLFVSIHCNSVKNFGPSGTETFVMGLSRADMNIEVAKAENAVIYLEDNYKQNYQGFDPTNPESLLGLNIMQEENLNNSINLATKIQDNFTNNLNRKTRGVKQQPLWVLDAAYMPSVLIELGFLSNMEEGEFLNSLDGQNKMALEIANAIISYKNEYFGQTDTTATIETNIVEVVPNTVVASTNNSTDDEIIYKIQLSTSERNIKLIPKNFKGLDRISSSSENNTYKYFYGLTSNYEEAKKLQLVALTKGYSTAIITAFKNGKSVDINEVIK
ncbi:N-acetylmuramoyl-L-alanine amidase [Flavobacterium sp.]|uniref:N-acetylmuramoyl-L-alanine amidase family protein n=1 Tax=Flavobacterium sp. TaxID=239 RepID=UPI00375395DB